MSKNVEWANFLQVTAHRPLFWILYLFDFIRLVFRRVLYMAHLRVVGSGHRGIKQWPKWLGTKSLTVKAAHSDELHLPDYLHIKVEALPVKMPKLQFEKDDCEAYFSANRWGNCILGSLYGRTVAESAIANVLDWINNQPVRNDPAWEPYSASERVVNLAVMLSVHQEIWKNLVCEDKGKVVRFFVDSAQWIHDRLEYYGTQRTNNHILNNARAIIVAGSLLDDRPLIERGLKLFIKMSKLIILQDGSLRERSSHYQCIVTNWLLDVVRFAPMDSSYSDEAKVNSNELEVLAGRMRYTTGMILGHSATLQSYIGDISPDSHPVLSQYRFSVLYGDKEVSRDESSHKSDDWISIKSGENMLLACAMPTSYPIKYNTHGHDDLGSFIWAFGKQAILVDRGRSSYKLDKVDYFQCGASSHNTIKINGLDPLSESIISFGEWLPTTYARASIDTYLEGKNGFAVSHSGFSRISKVGQHRRTVTIDNDNLEICDRIDGEGVVDIEFFWHFSTDLFPVSEGQLIIIGNELQTEIKTDFECKTSKWYFSPHSTSYGDCTEGSSLRLVTRIKLPWKGITKMRVTPCVE
jgi:hypothetical protein